MAATATATRTRRNDTGQIVPHNWGYVARFTGNLQTEGAYRGRPELEFARKGKAPNGEWGGRVTEPGVYEIRRTRDNHSRYWSVWDGVPGPVNEHWFDIPSPRDLFKLAPDLYPAAIAELSRPGHDPESCAVCGDIITIRTSTGWWACESHHTDLEPVTSQPPADMEAPF